MISILIKSHPSTQPIINIGKFPTHVSGYWNFLHKKIWESFGHTVTFIGEDGCISDWKKYDILFFRGYNSFRYQPDFAINLLKGFRGKKILYLEGFEENDIGQHFDTVFIPELDVHYDMWKKKYPNINRNPVCKIFQPF